MKKWVKIVLFSVLGILVIIGFGLGYLYYSYEGKYESNLEKHPHSVGYLSEGNRDFSENYKRCNDNKPFGYYSSAGNKVYAKSKRRFKKNILAQFNHHNYTDTGILNLRFIINCEGNIGDMEVNELNNEYVLSKLNSQMVEELIQLTVQKENWNNIGKANSNDVYMYLIYKIKNGKITEILP